MNSGPDPVTLKTALAANPEVNEDFSASGFSDLLGVMAMSLAYPGDGSGLSKTFETELSLVLDPGSLNTPQNLMIGLLDPIVMGMGFDSLTFQIKRGTAFVVNQTFTDLATALTFFDNSVIDLGGFAGGSSSLSFLLRMTSDDVGSGFGVNFLAANTSPGAGLIPEPTTVFLLMAGALGFSLRPRNSR